MPSLIGNKPNQVPSNGDLGTLAYQDGVVPAGSLVGTTATQTLTNKTLTAPTITGAYSAPNSNGSTTFGFKNRIINGAMVIDQRNAGASVTPTDGQYVLDRWYVRASQASKFTVQQNAGSVTPPVGFSNYLGCTSSSAYSISASDYFQLGYAVEGYNIADLAWGTANAKTVTLSFQVYSSLTGTFAGLILSTTASHSYPFTYTISSANTWTNITLTIVGPQVATWNTTNGTGLVIRWGFGIGSSLTGGTNNTWNSGASWSSAGTSVVGTNGATFYITGVQLEVGSTASSFDYRPYGTELALCQRYYELNYGLGYAIGSASSYPNNYGVFFQGFNTTNGQKHVYDWFKVTKRTFPTVTYYDYAGNAGKISALDAGGTPTNNTSIGYTPLSQNNLAVGNTATWYGVGFFWTASAEL